MIHKTLRPVILLISLISAISGWAQVKPVDASVILNAPYSLFYSNYAEPGSNNLQASLTFKDFNEPSFDVRLRLTIESSNVKISTSNNFIPSNRLTLTPGVPFQVVGADWADYFDLNNVDVSGITKQELTQNGRIPEGFYSFCVEVLDYETGKVISDKSCASAWLSLSNAPVIVLPTNGSTVPAYEPQNITFQWQLFSTPSPNVSAITYKFFMYEVLDDDIDPLYALSNGKALLVYESEDLFSTTLQYNVAFPSLEAGKKYMYNVQAVDPEGKSIFKNNGFSENAWFSYGYATGGNIELQLPEVGAQFLENDAKTFSWTSPDNLFLGQEYNYKLRIVKQDGNEVDDQDQIDLNATWYEQFTIPNTSNRGWQLEINQPIEEETNYLWQVTAYSDGQEIAKSNISSFAGPSLVDYFNAGQHLVYVKSLDNFDLTKLSGTGYLPINEDGSETVLVNFEDIHLIKIGGRYVLEEGEIIHDLPKGSVTELTPVFRDNNTADFFPSQLKLNKDALEIKGFAKWPLPHPTTGDEMAYIITQEDWVNFDRYKAFGSLPLMEENQFDLLDPFGFRLEFDESSEIEIVYNDYELKLDGKLILPENSLSLTGQKVDFQFFRITDLLYIQLDEIELSEPLALIDQTTISLSATRAIIDFSEKTSPQKLRTDKEWKGVYFSQFAVNYPKLLDASDQLIFEENHENVFELLVSNDYKSWVSAPGITLYVQDEFETGTVGKFNQFESEFTSFEIDLENGSVTDSEFKGEIRIPVIDKQKVFTYTIPIAEAGFEAGFLDESLEHSQFVFSPYGGENRVDLKIVKATFADNERLDMVIDIAIPYIGAEMNAVSDFRVYGDYYIGFGSRNGAQDLAEQVEGEYDGFTVYLDLIGAALIDGEYTFSYSATMPLGEEVAGEDGAPRLDIFSSAPLGEEFAVDADNSVPTPAMPKPIQAEGDPQKLTMDSLGIEIICAIAEAKGYLIMTKDDPIWGTSLQGGISGELKMPARVALGANMILGTKEELKYWYFDAWFVDDEGMGLTVFNMFNLVGFEGKVYRHMRINNESGPSDKPNVKIDEEVDFGAGMYMQIVDQGGGHQYMSDVGLELVVEGDDFTVSLSGDISVLNAEGRSKLGASQLKKAVAEEIAKEAAKQALAALGDIDVTVPLGGGKELGIFANESKGRLSYEDGGTSLVFSGDISAVPEAGVLFSSDGHVIDLHGDVEGGGSMSYTSSEVALGLSYYEATGAALNLGVDGKKIDLAFDKKNERGSCGLDIDGVTFDLMLDKKQGEGEVELVINPSQRFYAYASKEGIGEFELQYDNVFVGLKANKAETAGEMKVQVGDDFFAAGLNKEQQTGHLNFSYDNVSVDAVKEAEGNMSLDVVVDENEVNLAIDIPNGRGSLAVTTANESVKGYVDKAGLAGLDVEVGSVFVGMSVNSQEKAGSFNFKDPNVAIGVQANQSAKTGEVYFSLDTDSVYASVAPDEQKLMIDVQGTYLSAERLGTSGEIEVRQGDKTLKVGGDPEGKRGFVHLISGEESIKVEANQLESTGSLVVVTDVVKLNAQLSKELSTFDYDDSDVQFSAEGNTEYGKIAFAKDGQNVGLTLSKAGDQKISFSNSSLSFSGSTNLTTKASALSFTQGDLSFGVAQAEDLASVEFEKDGYAIALSTNKTSTADLSLKYEELDFEFNVDKDQKIIGLDLQEGENRIKFNVNTPERTGDLILAYDGLALNTDLSGEAPSLEFGYDGMTYGLAKTDVGGYTVKFDVSGNSYQLMADAENKFSINLLDGANLSALTDLEASAQIDGFDFSSAGGSLTMTKDGYSIGLNESEGVTLGYEDNSLQFSSEALSFQMGSGKNLSVTKEGATVNYDNTKVGIDMNDGFSLSNGDKSFAVSTTNISAAIGSQSVSLSNDMSLDIKADALESLTIDKEQLSLSIDGKQLTLGASKSIAFSDGVRNLSFNTEGVEIIDGTRGIKLSKDMELELFLEEGKGLSMSPKGMKLLMGESIVAFGEGNILSYSDNDRTFDLNGDAISITQGEHALSIKADKSLELISGADKQVNVSLDGVDVKYLDKEVSFSASKSLSYVDADRSFSIEETGLKFDFDGDIMELTNEGTPAIKLIKDGTEFNYSEGRASINTGDIELGVGGDSYFDMKYDGKQLLVAKDQLRYEEGERIISFGGDNLVELKEGKYAVGLSNELELSLTDEIRTFTINPEKELTYVEGDHSIALGGDNLIAYENGANKFKVYSPEAQTYGFGVEREGYSLGVEGGVNKAAALTVSHTDLGSLTVSADEKSNITASLNSSETKATLKSGKQGLELIIDGQSQDPPENLEGAAEVDYSGPQYIGNISEGANGRVKGHVEMYYNSAERHFIANASVKSYSFPCLEGALAVEASPETWSIDVGTENQPISVYPTCAGFGGGGWLNVTPETIGIGVFAGFKAGGSVDLSVAEIGATIEAELGIKAKATIQPKFFINEAGLWVRIYAGVWVDPAIGSKFTIAEVELKGDLTAYFVEEYVEGALAGRVSCCGISASFDMDFKMDM